MKTRRQGSWAGGAFAAEAPAQVPTIGALDLENMLLDDEGSLRRRGGCAYLTTVVLATAIKLAYAMYEGRLAGEPRTVFWSEDGLFIVDAAGTSLVRQHASSTLSVDKPQKPVVVGEMVMVPTLDASAPGEPGISVYGGSRKTATYSTGTISVTQGTTTVTGAGTAWLANADAGMLFSPTGSFVSIPVRRVNGDASLELAFPWPYTSQVAVGYNLSDDVTAIPGNSPIDPPTGILVGQTKAPLLAVVANRLVIGWGSELGFSKTVHPDYGSPRPFDFTTTDRHRLEGDLLALATLRDRLFAFTTAGVFVVSNMQYEIVGPDAAPQHRIEHYSRDVIALEGGAGIATYRDSLIVPANDDIYLMDGLVSPEPITRSARRDWRLNVKNGLVPGNAAVFRGHYLLPLLNTSTDAALESWAFRLDRPVETSQGVVFPWTRITGQGGQVGGFGVREGSARKLVAAGLDSTPRVRIMDGTPMFDTGATNSADPNAVAVVAKITTRDFAGGGLRTVWRFLRARYRLSDATGAESVAAEVSTGGDSSSSWSAIGSNAPVAEAAQGRWSWPFNRMAEYVRFRLTATGGDEFVLHELEVDYEEPGR